MATTNNITTTYAGEFAGKYISPALLNANSIFAGGVEVKPNVKYKEVIKKLTSSDLLKDASCDFTATGTLNLTERILEPKEMQVNINLCKKDYRSDWEAVEMGYSAFDQLPPSFADFLIGHIAGKVAEANEQSLWVGDKANSGEYDGIVTLLNADAVFTASSRNLTGTTVTSANVIDELGKVVDAIPSAVYTKEDLNIYVSQNVARAYVRALGGFAAAGLGANGTDGKGTQWYTNGALSFDGVKIFVANGLSDNQMIAAEKSNLFFGTGLLNDHNEVKVLDMADLDGSQNVRVIMRFTAGAQYGNQEDIVAYGI